MRAKPETGFHQAIADALEDILSAGACERAAIINPESALSWRALAAAKRRDAHRTLNGWARNMDQ